MGALNRAPQPAPRLEQPAPHAMPKDWDPSALLALLYDAAAGFEEWAKALQALSEALDAQASLLFTPSMPPETGLFLAHGAGPDAFAGYAASDHAKYLRLQAGERTWLRTEAPAARSDLGTARRLATFASPDDGARPLDIFHMLSAVLSTEAHALLPRIHVSLFRPIDRPDFEETERRKLAWLHPHLERALAIHSRLDVSATNESNLAEVLDRLAAAVVLLDRDGRVAVANQAARALIKAGDGLVLKSDGLFARARADDAALQRAVLDARGGTASTGAASCVCAVARPSGKRPYQIIVAPVSRKAIVPTVRDVRTMLFIVDPEAAPAVPTLRIARMLGLTGAEARLAAALADGRSLAEYAQRAGISIGTARWTLKQALAKTGTEKQAALVALVLKTAIIRSDE